jgi:flagellar motor protein MotB
MWRRVVRGPKKALSLVVVAALASVSIVVVAKDAMAATPTVASLSPSSGAVAGGTTVTVTGSGFYDGGSSSAVTGVTVGGFAATSVAVASDTSLTFVSPVRSGADRSAGPSPVVVTTSGGSSGGSVLFTFRPTLQSISSGLVTLGSLAVASQRKAVSRTTIQPYTVSGTYSAGTSAASGAPYSYVTDRNYTGRSAYLYESDERTTTAYSTTSATNATPSGRTGIYKLASSGGCASTPNGSTEGTNTMNGYETYCSAFGPEVYSDAFYVGAGMSLAFDWAAEFVTDDYEVYGYLIALSDLNDTTYSAGDYSVVAHGIGNGSGSVTWYTASAAITSPGFYKFRFVNGTYDATGGHAIGSNMYIDPAAVIVARTNALTVPAIADKIAAADGFTESVTLSSTAGGTVTMTSSTTSVCTVSAVGNVYTVTKVADGTCNLTASQGATGEYAPATTVLRSFQYLAAAAVPVVSTGLTSSVGASTATLSGSVTPRGAATDASFCYGTASNLSGCTLVSVTPQIGANDTATAISNAITGLTASTTYYYRAVGVNSAGTTNGTTLSFTTSSAGAPSVTTDAASTISSTGVTLNATVSANGAATTSSFLVCADAALTVGCTTLSVAGTTSGASDPISTALTGLAASTTYYFRVSATNGVGGTIDGSTLSFTTTAASSGGSGGGVAPTPTPTPSASASASTAAVPTLDPVVVPVTEAVRPGGSVVLVGGVPTTTTLAPNTTSTGLTVSGPDWSLGLGAVTPEGKPAPLGKGGVVDARTGTSLAVSGVSFAPGTEVKIYILVPPMTLGTLIVNADGTFSGRVSLPLTLSPGSYTVQVNGYSPSMSTRSASLGIGVLSNPKSVVKRIKRTVYFERMSSKLTAKSKKVIAKAVSQIPRSATNVTVQSVAYVQPEAYRGNDFKLSAQRAQNVGSRLKAKGVKGRFYVSGKGRAKQTGSKARRTEIVIAYTVKR